MPKRPCDSAWSWCRGEVLLLSAQDAGSPLALMVSPRGRLKCMKSLLNKFIPGKTLQSRWLLVAGARQVRNLSFRGIWIRVTGSISWILVISSGLVETSLISKQSNISIQWCSPKFSRWHLPWLEVHYASKCAQFASHLYILYLESQESFECGSSWWSHLLRR